MSCDNCDIDPDIITSYKEAIKNFVLLFQTEISDIIMGKKPSSSLKDLFLSKSYADGFKALLYDLNGNMTKVKNCIQCYKIQSENGSKIENKATSIVMYSDTMGLIKVNIIKTIILVVGIISMFIVLYFLNKPV